MIENFSAKKKLLILGGNALSCDIVRAAKDMGIYSIVTDWYDTVRSPAKLLADEYWDISTTDYKMLVSKVQKEHISGILTGFSDSYLLPYQHLCELCHLPCYASKEQFEWTLDKSVFKKICRMNGVPTVPEYDFNKFDPCVISEHNKVIIKPVDNSGSRGICLCDNSNIFNKMLQHALDNSEKKKVVIERYMDCDDISFEYVIQDGKVTLSAICDRYFYKTENAGSVTSKLIYPSKYIKSYTASTDQKVREMFRNSGLRNGILFLQAFAENDKFYFYEMGYRLSGGRHYIFTENQNGRNSVKELINFAFYGKMADRDLSKIINPYFNEKCCQLSVVCKNDNVIARMEGFDAISQLPEVIDCRVYHEIGDKTGEIGTSAQILSRIHIVGKTFEELVAVTEKIKQMIHARNEKGEDIIIDTWQTHHSNYL